MLQESMSNKFFVVLFKHSLANLLFMQFGQPSHAQQLNLAEFVYITNGLLNFP